MPATGRLAALLIVGALTIALAACQGNEPAPNPNPPNQALGTAAEVTLTDPDRTFNVTITATQSMPASKAKIKRWKDEYSKGSIFFVTYSAKLTSGRHSESDGSVSGSITGTSDRGKVVRLLGVRSPQCPYPDLNLDKNLAGGKTVKECLIFAVKEPGATLTEVGVGVPRIYTQRANQARPGVWWNATK